MSEFNLQDFIQDFLDEANEHLQRITSNLLAYERILNEEDVSVDAAIERVSLVDELFRSFHTLKGLSGMMGLQPAEVLSHAVESVLRSIQQAEIEPTPALIDRLLQAASVLQSLVESVGDSTLALPDVTPQVSSLQELLPQGAGDIHPGATGAEGSRAVAPSGLLFPDAPGEVVKGLVSQLGIVDRQKLAVAFNTGQKLSLALYTPSPEKSEQNLNVSVVRSRLAGAGTLIKAVPIIDDASETAQGVDVRFAFLLASDDSLDRADFPEVEWLPAEWADQAEAIFQNPAASQPEGRPASSAREDLGAVTVRVDLARLDVVMHLVSELIVSRSRLVDLLPKLSGAPPGPIDTLQATVAQMERHLRELRRAVMRTRMVPLAEVFNHMPLVVREMARAMGKEVDLLMEGESTEVDRALVERLLDPLLHIVRNAIIHGLETPAERREAGKPVRGTLLLQGRPEGDLVVITVRDDGRGVDLEQVVAIARAAGWLDSSERLTGAEALEILAREGFSTREEADLGSGRGVGLGIASRGIQALGGSMGMETQPGQGTSFTLRLPLTLTIANALIVSSGSERFAVPLGMVVETIEVNHQDIVQLESGELLSYRGESLAIFRLDDLFHLESDPVRDGFYGLVIGEGAQHWVLGVDRLLGMQEIVVRTVQDPLVARPGILGATELGDGSVILILEMTSLFRLTRGSMRNGRGGAQVSIGDPAPGKKRRKRG